MPIKPEPKNYFAFSEIVKSSKPTGMKKVFCNLFGHHYSVSKKVTQHIKEYECIHCGREVTTDVNGNLSALTPELQEINKTLENLFKKRHRAAETAA